MPTHSLVERAAALCHTTVRDFLGQGKTRSICRARFAIVLILRRTSARTYEEIAEVVGRERSSTDHAIRRAKGLYATDPTFVDLVIELYGRALPEEGEEQ